MTETTRPSIAVLMSTYNGEKYLRQQLQSIQDQEGVTVSLIIRDDGSSDGTLALLRDHQKQHPNVTVEEGKNLGVGRSFMRLVYLAGDGFDYYAFADQDDIWMPEKLQRAVACLKKSGKGLYASNQLCVDKNGAPMGMRYEKGLEVNVPHVLTSNPLSGCTMVFTGKLRNLLSEEARRPSDGLLHKRIHDVWVCMAALVTYGVYYDENAYIRYRQHEHNVVGAGRESIGTKLKHYRAKIASRENRAGRSALAGEIAEKFGEFVSERSLLRLCADTSTFGRKWSLIRHSKVFRQYTGESVIGFALKVFTNYF